MANGFLFNLERIFEDFVTTAVGEQLVARHGGTPSSQHPCHPDVAETLPMRPDLVWMIGDHALAVVDAKYKPGQPREDVYQMLA